MGALSEVEIYFQLRQHLEKGSNELLLAYESDAFAHG